MNPSGQTGRSRGGLIGTPRGPSQVQAGSFRRGRQETTPSAASGSRWPTRPTLRRQPSRPRRTQLPPKKRFHTALMGLPLHLRSGILNMVLVSPIPIVINRHDDKDDLIPQNIQPQQCRDVVNVRLTCRKLRAEAGNAFYSRNTFVIGSYYDLADLITMLSPTTISMITRLNLHNDAVVPSSDHPEKHESLYFNLLLTAFSHFTRLTRIVLDLPWTFGTTRIIQVIDSLIDTNQQLQAIFFTRGSLNILPQILCDCRGEDHQREIDSARQADFMRHWIRHLPPQVTLPDNADIILGRDSGFLDAFNSRLRDRATEGLKRMRKGKDPINPATDVPNLIDDPESPPALSGPSTPDSDRDETSGHPALTSHPLGARRPFMGTRERIPIEDEPIWNDGEIMDEDYEFTEFALGNLGLQEPE